jgi:hypothetical protein
VVFDPPTAAPGTTVTITPDPVSSDGFIPIVSDCPREGRLRMGLDTPTTSASSPLVGDDQLARFTVPETPPGEYEAFVFCGAINLGMGVGVFRVLAAPEGTPAPTPEATPAGTPTPSQSATPRPNGGVIDVYKTIDADGNLDTVDDQTAGEGWEFEAELTVGTIVDAIPVTDEFGFAEWLVEFGAERPTAAVTELPQDDFELIAASCRKYTGNDPADPFSGGLVGEVDGNRVTFPLDERAFPYECKFYNAPSPGGSVGGATATPPSHTLPPTDSGESTSTPTSDGWRVMLVVLAGILAAALVSIPVLATNRTISRRR